MNELRHFRHGETLFVSIVSFAVTGCFQFELADDLLMVPAGVAAVEDLREPFLQPDDHPLLHVAAGTVMDNLAGLEGCWGSYFVPEPPAPISVNVEFYQFDFESNEVSYQVLQRGTDDPLSALLNLGLVFDVSTETGYAFDLTGPDRMTLRIESLEFSSNLVVPLPEEGEEEAIENVEPLNLQITLDGDAFKIGDSLDAASEFEGPHRAALVFFRFECPR